MLVWEHVAVLFFIPTANHLGLHLVMHSGVKTQVQCPLTLDLEDGFYNMRIGRTTAFKAMHSIADLNTKALHSLASSETKDFPTFP